MFNLNAIYLQLGMRLDENEKWNDCVNFCYVYTTIVTFSLNVERCRFVAKRTFKIERFGVNEIFYAQVHAAMKLNSK